PFQAGPAIQRLPVDFQVPAPNPSLETGTAPDIPADKEPSDPEFVWAGNLARCLGTVLHRVFKDLAEGGDRSMEKIDEQALKSALLGEGLSHNQAEDAAAQAIKAVRNILGDETGRWILKKRQEQKSEFPLTGILENNYHNRIIDRTFVDENGTRWIVDFKTGEHQGTDLEGFFEEEKERYRPQLDQYEKLIRLGGETRPIKKALYYPMHQRLIEIF
ncbi:MAG: PD-(D/E)XK nuclease family protein, partial [Nitrospinales bacterium]